MAVTPIRVTLGRPLEDDCLVPNERYDVLPTYYIFGGAVFSPLSRNLLKSWGSSWYANAPNELMAYLSANFPEVNASQPAPGAQGCSSPPCSDAFVANLTAAGNVLAFSTDLGGSRNENAGLLDTGSRTGALGIALDAGRNVIVTGTTESEDFPVPNGAQTVLGGLTDVFVAKLRDDGRALLYGTLLGGGGNEYSGDVAADGFGVAWVTGSTFSGSFPVRDALQPALAGGADAFLARIDTAQSGNASLEYATSLGGTDSDYGMAVALDAAGDAYLAGHTLSLDFPVAGAFQAANGSAGAPSPRDGFLAKVDGAGSTLLYGTYLGGGDVDLAYALEVNGAGQAAVAGRTFSDDFPLRDPWQSVLGGSADAFVAFLDPARSGAASLLYSTYLGGAASDLAYGVAVGGGDAVFLAGSTSGTSGDSLPVTATIGPNGASTGVLVAKLDPRLQYWVPVASRGPGAKGSVWRSDLAVANGADAAAEVTLRLVSGSKTYTSSLPLAAATETMVADVAGRLAFNGNGAIEVLSNRPLRLASRTYNAVAASAECYAGGTFGQNYDPATAEVGLRAGESAWLPQLVETPAYRTNLILTNAGRRPAGATVALYSGAGALLKSFQLTVPAGEMRLESQPFLRRAGQGNLTRAFARVWVDSGYGVLASASVIDNLTNDPTTIAMVPAGLESAATWVPVASRASGAKGSLWRTDLGLLNPSTLAAGITLRFRSGGKVVVNTETVAANSQSILTDVVGKLPASGTGSLEVTGDRGVVVTSRTYNLIAGTAACFPLGTLGQSYPAVEPYAGLAAGETAWLVGLVETPAFRTNITLTNTGPSPATATVTLFGGTGASLGGYTVTLAAGELKQSNQPFAAIGKQSNLTAGYARVAVTSGSGVVALASVIDNLTNDPTTVAAQW